MSKVRICVVPLKVWDGHIIWVNSIKVANLWDQTALFNLASVATAQCWHLKVKTLKLPRKRIYQKKEATKIFGAHVPKIFQKRSLPHSWQKCNIWRILRKQETNDWIKSEKKRRRKKNKSWKTWGRSPKSAIFNTIRN